MYFFSNTPGLVGLYQSYIKARPRNKRHSSCHSYLNKSNYIFPVYIPPPYQHISHLPPLAPKYLMYSGDHFSLNTSLYKGTQSLMIKIYGFICNKENGIGVFSKV